MKTPYPNEPIGLLLEYGGNPPISSEIWSKRFRSWVGLTGNIKNLEDAKLSLPHFSLGGTGLAHME